jgi:hypothetical protein
MKNRRETLLAIAAVAAASNVPLISVSGSGNFFPSWDDMIDTNEKIKQCFLKAYDRA